jgi:aspartyl-tRNA(Asn)/glutamyl-tRNA(Gln) amidotransferase subunit B
MRSKEEAADYRYFYDPDLPLVSIDQQWIETVRASMPELPFEKFDRYVHKLGLTPYEADILVSDTQLADYFERAYAQRPSKAVVNWILRDVLGYAKEYKQELSNLLITPVRLAALVGLVEDGVINSRVAQELSAIVAQTGKEPADVVKERGLEQVGSVAELELMVNQLIAEHPQEVTDYRAGKEKLFGFFVGQAMKRTQGKGDPKIIQQMLKKALQP